MWINSGGLTSPVVLRATLCVVQQNKNMFGRQNKRFYFQICAVVRMMNRGIFWWKVQVQHLSRLTAIVRMKDVVSSRKRGAPEGCGQAPGFIRLPLIIAAFCWPRWARASDSQRAMKVPLCRNLVGNRCEARSNAAASSPYWQHLDGSP